MHRVEKIIQTLEQLLKRTPKLNALVERARSHPYSPEDLPGISIRQGAERPSESNTVTYYQPIFEILIDLTINGSSEKHHETWLNELRTDLSLLIELDTTLGLDFVLDINEVESTEPSPVESAEELMTQTIVYECHYRRLRKNPNV